MSTTTAEAVTEPLTPERLHEMAAGLVTNIRRVVRGHDRAVELVVASLLAGGHALIEDVPGTGKTTMARALAASVGGAFGRVQGTADLLPMDITGSNTWDQSRGVFTFIPGPVFANVLLVDEINRTPPRTQSAFLEVMEEGAVTIDGIRHEVPRPFYLIATQNPLEQFGTYPLPESQLDRFAVKVELDDIGEADEIAVVREQLISPTVEALAPVVTVEELSSARALTRRIYVADAVLRYAVGLVRTTRQVPELSMGASPRAALTMIRIAQAHAAIRGLDFVTPDDVKAVAVPVLTHRVVSESAAVSPQSVILDLLTKAAVPVMSSM